MINSLISELNKKLCFTKSNKHFFFHLDVLFKVLIILLKEINYVLKAVYNQFEEKKVIVIKSLKSKLVELYKNTWTYDVLKT